MFDKRLLALLGNEKKYIWYTTVLMTVGLLANVTITASLCYAIDLIAGYGTDNWDNLSRFAVPFLTAASGLAVRYISTRAAGNTKDILSRKVKKDLRKKVYNKLIRFGIRSSDDMKMAGMTQISVEGIEQLDLYYSTYMPQLVYAMCAPVILFFITVWVDWRAALVLLICVPLIPLSIAAVSRYAKKIFTKYWGKYISMGDSFLDSVQGLKELKIFGADGAQQERMNSKAEEFRKITMKVLVMQLASATIMDMVAYGGAGAGIAVVIAGLADHNLSAAEGLFLVLTAAEFFLPLRTFGSAFHIAMNGASAGSRILDLLKQPDPVWGDGTPENMEIEIKDVTFSYDGRRAVLNRINMRFPEKGMAAIVGGSGCGKSTLAGILSGALRPSAGTVSAGGKEISALSREAYYRRLGIVSCGTYIFNETVRDNFLLACRDVSEDKIYAALEKVNLADFIRSNGGLDQMITEDAANISGGQKQRLALAVNLAADKDVYIFDEATSNIDIESEQIIMKNIRELAREKSVIVISHRLENIVPADLIYFIESGTVRSSGRHRELMETCAGYAKLYTTQKNLEKGYMEGTA